MSTSSEAEKTLSFFCQSHSSFKTKLGLLSLDRAHFPSWFEKVLLTIEYIQLFSITILIHPSLYEVSNKTIQDSYIFEVIAYAVRLANPSYLLSFTHNDATTNAVLGIILGYIFFKYIMLSYVIYTSWFNKTPNSLLKTTWRWIFKLQGRIACCFITSFWVRTIVMTSNDSFSIQGISNRVLMAVSAVLIILEYLISFLLETQFCNFMPSKQYLAGKNFEMQIITLLQKFVIQIIKLFAYKNFSASIWVCIILNLAISSFRGFRFFTTLPLYDFKTLLYQGDLLVITLSLHFVHFFQQILNEADYLGETNFRFIIISWILFGILACMISRAFLQQIYLQLLTSSSGTQGNPNLLLHKVFATEYIIENTKMPTNNTDKTDIKHLLGITQSLNLPKIFNIQPQKASSNILTDNKEETDLITLEYLQNLSNQFPKNPLIQLNLAYQKYKSPQFHSNIIKITSKLNQSPLSPYYTSSALLLCDLETKNLAQLRDLEEKHSLDLINYMDNQILMQDLRIDILKQIALRTQICNHIIGEKANLETIYQNAQIVYRSKTLIQKKISSFLKRAPESYLHPYLVLAEYSLYLNYSIEDYHNYFQNYMRKLTRFTKEFSFNHLSQENLYQDENAFVILAENNSIAYSTKSLQTICGSERNSYRGTFLAGLFPRCLREYYTKIFREIFEKGQTEFTNKGIHVFLCHKEGWLIEAEIFVRVHPYMSQNLYLDLFIRPHRTITDAILLDETGKIEGATRNINQLVKADQAAVQSSVYINQISSELADLNAAFNIVNLKNIEVNLLKQSSSKRKTSSLAISSRFRMSATSPESPENFDKALRIFNRYTEEHKSIELPLPPNGKTFKCQISSLDFKIFDLNLIRLEGVFNKHLDGGANLDNSVSRDSSSLQDLGDMQEIKPIETLDSNRDWLLTTREFNKTIPTVQDEPDLKTHNFETDENLLISPTSRSLLRNTLINTPRKKDTPPSPREAKINTDPAPISNQHLKSIQLPSSLSVGSASSKMSQISGVFKTFQQAINTRSYQKSFNFLCLIFYGVILGTLVCQIILKSILDTTMDRLITKTELLNFAQTRAQQTCAIQNSARGCKMVFLGQVSTDNPFITDGTLRVALQSFVGPQEYLTQANIGIVNNLASEDDEIQRMIFERNIRMRGTFVDPKDTSISLITTLQHGDMIKSVIRYLNGLPLVASQAGSYGFDFLLNNAGNDFLVRNQEIVDAFQASVDSQRDHLQLMINLCVIVLPILLAGIVCLLAIIIFGQYTKEKRHLIAFLKLNPVMIQSVLESLKMFETRLIQQEKLKDELVPKLIYKLDNDTHFASYHKAHDSQIVISGNMQKRYIFYIVKVLFYIVLLISIVVINYVLITNPTDKIYRLQRQIQFANYIGSTGAITYIAYSEAYMSSNTNYVMGMPPYDQWKIGLQKWNKIQEDMYSEFQLEDGGYDPDVKAILFEPVDCNTFTAASKQTCLLLPGLGYPSDMVSTVNLYKTMLDYKLALYDAVDKTNPAKVLGAAVTAFNSVLAGYRVSGSQALLLSEKISEKLAKSVDDIYDLGTTILVIFSVTLFISSILIWFQILMKVKRVNDDFKKVLAVLPPNIILSSFLLKSFLNKTSNILQKL